MSSELLYESQEETRAMNAAFVEKVSSHDPQLVKEAIDAASDWTRKKMREESFARKILPPITITPDQLDRQVSTSKPAKVVDLEPGSPAAITIPFGTMPTNEYIDGERYLVTLCRIATPKFTKDAAELATWIMDIRQVLSDNAIRDIGAEEDGKFIEAVDNFLVGAGSTIASSGVAQYEEISGGIDRDTLWDALKVMPSTPFNLETHTVLVNNITIKDVCKFDYNEVGGGDVSADIMRNGWTLVQFMGREWVITIKKDLVATNSMYMFADPKFLGKSYLLEDVTMYIDRKAFMLEFFAHETIGGAFGHVGGLARVDFTP